jgi:2-polyprenyl-3-methyl-5-hydroxy-6-metoxy-1,4-benzoquinol methylase
MNHTQEVALGERFEFGGNWKRFLDVLDDSRVCEAETSLKEMLEISSLAGRRFVDIGSGSGLFSLAAHRLGASVHSFDYDPQSVSCTRELKRRYAPQSADWSIESGSVLDTSYLGDLGQFDIVYSWGVLHHTGRMWEALRNIEPLVSPGGRLFIAIYNDQGGQTRRWKTLKALYNRHRFLRLPLTTYALIKAWWISIVKDTLKGAPLRSWNAYKEVNRGMSPWHDLVDWIGGYPFEVAKPEQIFDFFRSKGFRLDRLHTCAGGHGCNEFVFTRITA